MRGKRKQRGRSVTTLPVSIVASIAIGYSALISVPSVAAQAIGDDFNDNVTDASLWSALALGTGPTVVETNQRVEVALPPGSMNGPSPTPGIPAAFNGFYLLACQVRGDFDVQVDYELLLWPPANGATCQLNAFTLEAGQFGVARSSSGGEAYLGPGGQVIPTGDQSGKFRLVRAGSTESAYYLSAGDWIPIHSAPALPGDAFIALSAFGFQNTFANQLVRVAFDNFVLTQGQLICPCGDGNIQPSEQCDDGNTLNGDGCDSSCILECTGAIGKPKLTIGKLNTPPGDDKLAFRGTLTLPSPFSPALDPIVNGMRLLIDDNGGRVLDVTIPGGTFVNPPGKGWKVSGSGTKWTYQDKTTSPPGGIYRAIIDDKSNITAGLVRFAANGKGGSYAVASGNLPVTARMVLAPSGGECGDVSFPICAFNASRSTLICK